MLRHTQFVESLISRCGKGSAYNLKQLTFKERKAATREAIKANSYLRNLSSEEFRNLKPSDLNKAIIINTCAGYHEDVLTIATRMAQEPTRQRFISADLYLLLLQLISALKDASKVPLAFQLCHELSRIAEDKEMRVALHLVFNCASISNDFTQLIPLRILFDSLLLRVSDDDIELRYLGTVVSILLNSKQYISAIEQFKMSLKSFLDWEQHKKLYSNFPITKLIESMCSVQDCHALTLLLRGASTDPSIIARQNWLKCLSLGLALNDYDLVKLIYDDIFASSMDRDISVDDVIFDNKLNRLENQNEILGSSSDSIVSDILHTFASHGDVTLCLSLIDLHYVHKTLKGKKGLTKEICIDIVRSYCFHDSNVSPIQQGEDDDSVKKVIDVMHNFMIMPNGRFTYKDVSDAFLQRMHNFRVFDKNVEDSAHRENVTLQRIQNSLEDETILPRKTLSAQNSKSKQGNVFMNLDILKSFVHDHAMYIQSQNYGRATMTLFLNCVLDHIQKYQNFSGIITVFEAISELNKNYASEWLDAALFDLLARCLATSPAAMAPGFKLYLYLRGTDYIFTTKLVENYIFSALRNPENTSLLEFYVHEYLSLANGSCSPLLEERISNIASKNESFRRISDFLGRLKEVSYWKEAWISENFVTESSQVLPNHIINPRYSEIDLRDLIRLDRILT